MARKRSQATLLRELRAFGLAYPGAHIKSPWPNHADLAVNDKTFAYLPVGAEPLSISCKLPHSSAQALELPFTEPTGYGLGRSGWVTATFEAGDDPPVELLRAWIDESYRAQAPKRLAREAPPFEGPTVIIEAAPTRASARRPARRGEGPTATKRKATRSTAPAKSRAKKKTGTSR